MRPDFWFLIRKSPGAPAGSNRTAAPPPPIVPLLISVLSAWMLLTPMAVPLTETPLPIFQVIPEPAYSIPNRPPLTSVFWVGMASSISKGPAVSHSARAAAV
jgi:hypothetical protein